MSESQNQHSRLQTIAMLRVQLKRAKRITMLLVFLIALLSGVSTPVQAATEISFTGGELLGKPTETSITINIVPDTTIEYHYQYGTSPGSYTAQTTNQTASGGEPHEVLISGLTANTRYYYRMRYHLPGEADWVMRSEHTFHTQRAKGEEFVFTITSDSHHQMNSTHQQAMVNVLADNPDFHLDLGDTFYVDTQTTQAAVDDRYLDYRDPLYMGRIGPSIPIFLSSGNHENEEGWNLDDTFSLGVASIQARKAFYPTPIDEGPGGFYSGNTDPLPAIDATTYGDQYRENYFAWTWGDALFVVIDPFQYTMNLPYAPNTAGEGSDDPFDGDQWSWTLGAEQFNWLKQTIENSDALYKFVFSHQMVGGIPRDISVNTAGYVRGGAEAAGYFEWGGRDSDGTWIFNDEGYRDVDDFGSTPIHQLFVENGVSAYFHGHDHQFVYETRDGVVYQEVPSPSMFGSGFTGIYAEGDYGDYQTIEIQGNAGHLRVTVNPTEAMIEYVRSNQTGVTYTYTIEPYDPTVITLTRLTVTSANHTSLVLMLTTMLILGLITGIWFIRMNR